MLFLYKTKKSDLHRALFLSRKGRGVKPVFFVLYRNNMRLICKFVGFYE